MILFGILINKDAKVIPCDMMGVYGSPHPIGNDVGIIALLFCSIRRQVGSKRHSLQ